MSLRNAPWSWYRRQWEATIRPTEVPYSFALPRFEGANLNSYTFVHGALYIPEDNSVIWWGPFWAVRGTTGGRISRNGICRTDSAGNVLAWYPATNSGAAVTDVVRDGNLLYLVGSFTSVAGQPLQYVARVFLDTGAADTSWDTNASTSTATSVHVDPRGVWVTTRSSTATYNGVARNGIVCLDAVTALPTAWDHGISSLPVYGVSYTEDTVYLTHGRGTATVWGGVARPVAAALDLDTGLPTAWDTRQSSSNGSSWSLVHHDGAVYIANAGNTPVYDGVAVNTFVVKVDAASGDVDTAWTQPIQWGSPRPLGVFVYRDMLYVFVAPTSFSTLNNSRVDWHTHRGILRMDLTSGQPDHTWKPDLQGPYFYSSPRQGIANSTASIGIYRAAELAPNQLIVTGGYTQASRKYYEVTRSVAVLDTRPGTGSWPVGPDYISFEDWGPVAAVVKSGDRYVVLADRARTFDTPGNLTQRRDLLSIFDSQWNAVPTATSLEWVTSIEDAICVADGWIYIATSRTCPVTGIRNLMRLDASTLETDPTWNPLASTSSISGIWVDHRGVWVSSALISGVTYAGVRRNGIACLDKTTALPTAWDPGVGTSRFDVASTDTTASTVYAVGSWSGTTFSGVTRSYAVALDLDTALPTAWDPAPSSSIQRAPLVDEDAGDVYLSSNAVASWNSGAVTLAGSTLVRTNAATGTVDAGWNPRASMAVTPYLHPYLPNKLLLGVSKPSFSTPTSIGGIVRRGIASVDKTTAAVDADPDYDYWVSLNSSSPSPYGYIVFDVSNQRLPLVLVAPGKLLVYGLFDRVNGPPFPEAVGNCMSIIQLATE
jgi:hypothetical protein